MDFIKSKVLQILIGAMLFAFSSQAQEVFYLTDHLGSARVVTNESGAEQARYAYYPFGQIRGSDLSQYATFNTYTNQKFDTESNLYYYGARYYEPGFGKFLSPDPLREILNLYTYARNNPLLFIDPDGKQTQIEDLKGDEDLETVQQAYRNTVYQWVDYTPILGPLRDVHRVFFDWDPVADTPHHESAQGENERLAWAIVRLGGDVMALSLLMPEVGAAAQEGRAAISLEARGKQYRIALGLKKPLRYHVKSLEEGHGYGDIKTYWGVVLDSRISPDSGMELSLMPGKKTFFPNIKTILENPNVEAHFTMNDFKVPEDMGAALAGESSRTDFEYAKIMRIIEKDPTQADRFHFYYNFGNKK
ncbi:MAG: RHS repeat-associated core domain-containing protein [Deltaproteobacteria bacterium]|nr:RHS repeat-associated core domain-containing protein [Deltaproteobacteria bacterium]